jgi:hypothetical protein
MYQMLLGIENQIYQNYHRSSESGHLGRKGVAHYERGSASGEGREKSESLIHQSFCGK